MRLSLGLFYLFIFGFTQATSAQNIDTSFQQFIVPQQMNYVNESFSGAGWDTLTKEIQKAQFVLVGETHGNAEVPLLTKEIARIFKPEVFVGETDPYTIKEINRLLTDKNPDKTYFAKNPWGLSFFSLEPEFQLLQYLHTQKVTLWGLDQVHLFSSARFFDMLVLEAKTKENKRLATIKATEFRKNDIPLLSEGTYEKLSIFNTGQNSIDSLIKAFKNESLYARTMLDDYNLSVRIYSTGSHSRRVNLMKRNLLAYSAPYLSAGKPLPKTLYKFGAMHTFRNESFNIIFDVGNLVSNLAQAQNKTSLHILAIGKAGTANRMNSSLEKTAIQPYSISDDGLDYLKPFLDFVNGDSTVLFDLRPIRKKLDNGKLQINNVDLKRIILGNDLLIIFGKVTGSTFKK